MKTATPKTDNSGNKQNKKQMMTGADIIIQSLQNEGVEVIFAYPGGASMELHQSLRRSKIRVVLPRHEQGGGFAATGYARASGKTGVTMATSGPGATNLVTSIADAYMDSTPLVAITGQVPQQYIGKTAFQETDIIGITRPIVKHSFLVFDPAELPEVIAKAFFIANSGRPGPVVIDIPKDVQQKKCIPNFNKKIELSSYTIPHEAKDSDVKEILAEIRKSERPCIFAGGGIILSDSHKELYEFATKFNIPVVTSLMGVGAFPEEHKLAMKWPGMHGTYYANYTINEADLIIGLGVRFDDRVTGNTATFAPYASIVHVDIDPSEINKNLKATVGAVCDLKSMLTKLNKTPIYKECPAWHKQVQEWKNNFPLKYNKSDEIQPQMVIEKLYEKSNGDATIVTGVGQHQMWAAQFYKFKRPRQLITSGGLGTMGFGLPNAVGAKIGCPENQVILIDGDGSFQMNIQELGMVHCESTNIKMVIMNNQHLGMVAQWEDRFYNSYRGNTELKSNYSSEPYPNFVQICDGYLVKARHVWNKAELDDAIEEMLNYDGAFLLDIHMAYQEHVLPMIPAGGTHKDIMID